LIMKKGQLKKHPRQYKNHYYCYALINSIILFAYKKGSQRLPS